MVRVDHYSGAVPAEALPLLPLSSARCAAMELRWGDGSWPSPRVTGAGAAAHLAYARGSFVEGGAGGEAAARPPPPSLPY